MDKISPVASITLIFRDVNDEWAFYWCSQCQCEQKCLVGFSLFVCKFLLCRGARLYVHRGGYVQCIVCVLVSFVGWQMVIEGT